MSGSVSQLPPQILAMLGQAMQQRPGGPGMGGPMQPPMAGGGPMGPGGGPMPPQQPQGFGGSQPAYQAPPAPGQPIAPPVGAPGQNMAAFGRAARMTPAEMASKGRLGDRVVAHMAPGEIAVPPEVQTPQVRQTLQQAFAQAGAPMQQFTVGSPTSSINPATGAPEYSFWSAILPVVGAIAGSFIPGIGTAAGMAAGGALGGAAGGAIDGGGARGALLGALGGAAGGFAGGGGLGSLGGLLGDAGAQAAGAAAEPLVSGGVSAAEAAVPTTFTSELATQYAGAPVIAGGGFDAPAAAASKGLLSSIPWKGAMLAGTGATLAGSLAPQGAAQAQLPEGFTKPMGPLNRNYNSILGNANSPTPSFAGYNPYAAVTGGGYNFFAPRFA